MEATKAILLTLAVVCFVRCNALVCKNGYSIQITNVANCAGPAGIITLGNGATVIVNDDCSLSMRGCLEVKGFKSAVGQVLITKNGKKVLNQSIDLCDPAIQTIVGNFLPIGICPVKQREVCPKPNMNLPVGPFLPMIQGSVAIELSFKHDTGNSCIRIEAVVSK